MAELGASSGAGHREVAELAGSLGIELVAYRTPSYGLAPVDDAGPRWWRGWVRGGRATWCW